MTLSEKKESAIKHLQSLIDAVRRDEVVIDSIRLETQPIPSAFNGVWCEFEPSNKYVETIVYVVKEQG